MDRKTPARCGIEALLSPAECANRGRSVRNGEDPQCQNLAGLMCGSCKLVQYCCKACQVEDWPHHKIICKSDLLQPEFTPGWQLQGRSPSWISIDDLQSPFGLMQYLWGKLPAVDVLKLKKGGEHADETDRDMNVLFAASGDIRNVVKSVADGLPAEYSGKCLLVINDLNFMVVARNFILLSIALSLPAEEAVAVMIHVWYSALLPQAVMDAPFWRECQASIQNACEKIKDKSDYLLFARTFTFGDKASLRLTLRKEQWNELKSYFILPSGLSAAEAQAIRRAVMLAPERVDYLHRALCNQTPPIRVATMTFRQEGLLLPHGASRDMFQIPNPTFFDERLVWPMKDDAGPLEGWDYFEYIKFAPRASNDVIGSLFYFLQDKLRRFCHRIKDCNLHFRLFNVDACKLPDVLTTEESQFDRIEISNICDRCYIGPEAALTTFSPLLKPTATSPNATLLILFINAVNEEYFLRDSDGKRRSVESQPLLRKFVPATPRMMISMMARGIDAMGNPDMIRLSSCYTMFGDFDRTFATFLKSVRMEQLARNNQMKIREQHFITQPWPLRVTDKSTKTEFDIRCGLTYTGTERYMELERE